MFVCVSPKAWSVGGEKMMHICISPAVSPVCGSYSRSYSVGLFCPKKKTGSIRIISWKGWLTAALLWLFHSCFLFLIKRLKNTKNETYEYSVNRIFGFVARRTH